MGCSKQSRITSSKPGACTAQGTPETRHLELLQLLDLTQRVGRDPLLTQASTGNSSAKIEGVLWIKASGKWMADAFHDDSYIPLDLVEVVTECIARQVDPKVKYPCASLETALHAILPHRMVLHVHCVDTIAWAVRSDGPLQLEGLLQGLRWQWIPYAASGLPLSRAINVALSAHPGTDLFVLGNHGLVVCGEDAAAIELLLTEVRRRVAVRPRDLSSAGYPFLREMLKNCSWSLPQDDSVHAFGTDSVAQAILLGGFIYPCQAIFSGARAPELFRPIPLPKPHDDWQLRYRGRPFLVVEGCGVVVSPTIESSELAMLSGLAQVVRRLDSAAPIRYLSDCEISQISPQSAYSYRELSLRRPAEL